MLASLVSPPWLNVLEHVEPKFHARVGGHTGVTLGCGHNVSLAGRGWTENEQQSLVSKMIDQLPGGVAPPCKREAQRHGDRRRERARIDARPRRDRTPVVNLRNLEMLRSEHPCMSPQEFQWSAEEHPALRFARRQRNGSAAPGVSLFNA